MGISAAGLGSGMDINAMVNKIVEAERIPKQERIDNAIADVETHISAFGKLKTSLSDMRNLMFQFRNENTFSSKFAISSDPDILAAQADPQSVVGVYSVEVEKLARSQKLVSGLVDPKADYGKGKLTITLGDQSMNLDFTEEEIVLVDLVRAINSSPDNPGVTASVINDNAGTRLVLTGNHTGAENILNVKINADPTSSLQSFNYTLDIFKNTMIQMQPPSDAVIVLDGLSTISSDTNLFEEAVQGLTINVSALTTPESGPVKISVEQDKQKAISAIESFAAMANGFFQMANMLSEYDPETQEGGPLVGDSLVRSSINQLRNLFTTPLQSGDSNVSTLSELGITTTLQGALEIDYELLNKQINQNYESLDGFFSGADGFSRKLENLVQNYINAGGSIRNRENTLSDQKLRLRDEQTTLDRRMEDLERRTMRQFSAMDNSVSEMKSQLSAMMGILPG